MNAPERCLVDQDDPGNRLTEDASPVRGDAVFRQLGQMTRQLHDTLERLGVMPRLQNAAVGLPDARSRLSYIAEKCGAAAHKVLTSVELAKAEQARAGQTVRALAAACAQASFEGSAAATVLGCIAALEAAQQQTNVHLTDIMLAQDYHDLTGQVVAKVVALAIELEDGLVEVLVQAAPERTEAAAPAGLEGPVHDPRGRDDVVTNQGEVDDLLASLGF